MTSGDGGHLEYKIFLRWDFVDFHHGIKWAPKQLSWKFQLSTFFSQVGMIFELVLLDYKKKNASYVN